MYPRIHYEMAEEDLKIIIDASKSTPAMMIGSYVPSTPQENANRAWRTLGEKMGFDPTTVRPIQGKGQRFFSAVPSETKEQREERWIQKTEKKKLLEIESLENEIAMRQKRLNILKGEKNG